MTNEKLAIWDALAKTDPAHTKPFNRAGGFKGTAIKPIWIIRKLTEQFGPCGVGWGIYEPTFEVVRGEGEVLVFCTVSAWHTDAGNRLWGVGGDKVVAKRKDGHFHDDEAFKKAFTDAVNNAFKFIGVGADVHMGLFDDDKYVSAAREEFQGGGPDVLQIALDGIAKCETVQQLHDWWDKHNAGVPEQNLKAVEDAWKARSKAVVLMSRVAA